MTEIYNKIVEEVELAVDELQSLVTSALFSSSDAGERNTDFDVGGDSGSPISEFDLDNLDLDAMSEEEIEELQFKLAEELMQNNPLQDIADGVTKEIMAGQAQPEGLAEHFAAFRSAINWSEKFVLVLIAFQVVMFFLCLYVSQRDRALAPKLIVMTFIFVVVRSAEWLNSLGEEHWESFATQDYFDKRGLFVGVMLCGPLMLDVLIMLFFFIREASSLLVQVKRTEIQRKKKSKKGEKGGKEKPKANRSKTEKQD